MIFCQLNIFCVFYEKIFCYLPFEEFVLILLGL
jgi:hypothetical protein